MPAKRFVLSLFFVWHIVAIGLGALSSPGAVGTVGPPRYPQNDVIAAAVTPRLDAFAAAVAPVARIYDHSPLLLRELSARYLELTGVSQSWKMFSNPPVVHQYLRVRYYVGPAGADAAAKPSWTATELVLPAHREDEVRIVRGYWAAFRDKAMTSALARFHGARSNDVIRPDTKSAELPDHLVPILHYFKKRFEQTALRSEERVLRSEIWYGSAPMPPAGDRDEPGRLEARNAVLQSYFQGPVENHFGRPEFPPYHAGQREADIEWVLEYFEP